MNVEHEVIELDGVLADFAPMWKLFCEVVLEREVKIPETSPPHTALRLAEACGLTQPEHMEVTRCLSEVEGLWMRLPPLPGARETVLTHPRAIYHARRFEARAPRGRAGMIWRDPWVQTKQWLMKLGLPKTLQLWVEQDDEARPSATFSSPTS